MQGAAKGKTVKVKKYSSLSGRYFWGSAPVSLGDSSGWKPRAVYFLNKKWAYVGFPKNGKKPSCKKSSSTCKRYAYNKKSGIAKIGKQKFRVTNKGFTYRVKKNEGKSSFKPVALGKKGARYSAKLIRHDWSGTCAISCTATTERLQLGKNGRFVWARSSVGSWPGLGSSWTIVPPNQRGTYKVISSGRIELRYANGKKKRYTFGLMPDIRGKASASEGVVLGRTNFYRP